LEFEGKSNSVYKYRNRHSGIVLSDAGKKRVPLSIPEDLYELLVKASRGKGFSSVDDLASYLLRISLSRKVGPEPKSEEEEKILQELKRLGYE
jgi:hypothetical protein